MVQRWSFHEPVANETYQVEINPNEGGTPGYSRTLNAQATLGGSHVIFEGPEAPQYIECSGSILDRAHLEGLAAVFRKRRQMLLTDDLGRQWWIYLETFTPTRQRSRREWRHNYSMRMLVLDTVKEFG